MAPTGTDDEEDEDEVDAVSASVSVSDGSDVDVSVVEEDSSDVSVTLRYPGGYCVPVEIPFEPVYIGNKIGLCIPLHVGSMVHVISGVSVQNHP